MLNLLLTLLTYCQMRADKQGRLMFKSQEKQDLAMQQSQQQSEILRQQTNEEQMVEAQFDNMDVPDLENGAEQALTAFSQFSNEMETKKLQLMSAIAQKAETALQQLAAMVEPKERMIDQEITMNETQVQALDADIKGVEEALPKRTEEVQKMAMI